MWFNRMWYSVPLVVVISLVYAATRHEAMKPILEHAVRFGLWIVAFMFVVFVILSLLTFWL
jgi:surface polysaccharide O-acyltransferase-like enzyme